MGETVQMQRSHYELSLAPPRRRSRILRGRSACDAFSSRRVIASESFDTARPVRSTWPWLPGYLSESDLPLLHMASLATVGAGPYRTEANASSPRQNRCPGVSRGTRDQGLAEIFAAVIEHR